VAIIAALSLIVFLLVRPQEFIPALEPLRLLNVATGLAAIGIIYEFVTGKQKGSSPQLPWLLAFLVWGFIATIARIGAAQGVSDVWQTVGFSTIFMMVVMYAGSSFEKYRAFAWILILVSGLISAIAVHQGRQEPQCIALDTSKNENEKSEGEPDGRSCENAYLCEREGKANTNYMCEKVGLFGTFTQGMRVRWRGTLGDPNELAVLVGGCLPFLFALNVTLRKKWFTLLMLGLLGLSLWCVVLTGSRGGQLVILTIFGIYFVKRYGMRGLLVGAVFALPVLMLGGREGEEAESSSLERVQLLYEGMEMIKAYPGFGVGIGQFVEHSFNYLTAHNSYVLAASELGFLGSFLWVMLVYVSVKIPYVIATRPPPDMDPRFVPFAYALFVSFCGILVGIFFLSFCYKNMLFIFFGLSGALFAAVRRSSPGFTVQVKGSEIMKVCAGDLVLLAFIFVYSRIKGQG
jgi:hypothetical protein